MKKVIKVQRLRKDAKDIEVLVQEIKNLECMADAHIPSARKLKRGVHEIIIPYEKYKQYLQEIIHKISSAGYSRLDSRTICKT